MTQTVKVVSYNIHGGTNTYRIPTLKKIAAYLRKTEADIIILQEVHQNSRKGRQADKLAALLDMDVQFADNHPIHDGYFGNAILSRFPIIDFINIFLPSSGEQRGLLVTTLLIDTIKIHAAVTHLAFSRNERKEQLDSLAKWIVQLNPHETPIILTGDLNTSRAPHLPPLTDLGRATDKDYLYTFSSLRKRIDYIYYSPHWRPLGYSVGKVNYSDHYPIIGELELFSSRIESIGPAFIIK